MPDPLTATVPGVLEALLTKLSVALAEPVADGVNLAVNDAVPPAEIVMGRVMPLTENSELVVPTDVIVTAEPVALIVPD